MWRDLGQYVKALVKHWLGLATGAAVGLALLLSEDVVRIDLPRSVFGLAAVAGLFLAGFLAWREEHAKVAQQGDAERLVEERQRLKALADKMVEEYIGTARRHYNAGPSAL